MTPRRISDAGRLVRVQTNPEHEDPTLRGRTYGIPFAQVWIVSSELADGGIRGWSLLEADEELGTLRAESRRPILRFTDEVKINISLDMNGQTRVDMLSTARGGRGDLGANARRVRSFFRHLDRRLGVGPGTVLSAARHAVVCAVLTLATTLACSPAEGPANEADTTGAHPADSIRNFQGRSYERHIVFLTAWGDSTLVVPWSFSNRTTPEGVAREIRAWLARSNTWDPFIQESWRTPPARVPWRILPHGPARIIVGEGDALERVFFLEGARQLEVELGELLAEWTGRRAQTFRVHRGATLISSQRVEGYVLDLARAWTDEDIPHGGWGFMVSGDSLQFVLEAAELAGGADPEVYTALARRGFANFQWEDVHMEWGEVRAFEPARRDVPVSWTLTSADSTLTGELASVNPFLEAGEGEGPVLPVDGYHQVMGTVTMDGATLPVRGFIRHIHR